MSSTQGSARALGTKISAAGRDACAAVQGGESPAMTARHTCPAKASWLASISTAANAARPKRRGFKKFIPILVVRRSPDEDPTRPIILAAQRRIVNTVDTSQRIAAREHDRVRFGKFNTY